MSDAVKPPPKRRYDSSRRRAQANEALAKILQAARRRFLQHGFAATTVAQIATDADVSVETVYKAFAGKAGLLKALFDVSVAGDDEPVPMAERDVIHQVIAAASPEQKIKLYADHLARVMPRVAPVQLLARDAAAADAGAADVWAQTRRETLGAMKLFAANLAETGRLATKPGETRDILFTYHAPELYELLVIERGWSAKRYGSFIAAALVGALVKA